LNTTTEKTTISHTALYAIHEQKNAKFVDFYGYKMPLCYPLGAAKEHLHTREKAGLFDVSHMGQLIIAYNEQSINELEKLIPTDLMNLPVGRQAYSVLLGEQGQILDDLIISRYQDFFYLVVNAGCKNKDINFINKNLSINNNLTILEDRSLIALQGPSTKLILAEIIPQITTMKFMDCKTISLYGKDCFIARCGYTGEDGFEISIPNEIATKVVAEIKAHNLVEWCGLAARDTLRLEAGLCLYGNDIDETTTLASSKLKWIISKNRRLNGDRPGGFNGSEIILSPDATLTRVRVGFIAEKKIPIRKGYTIIDNNNKEIGIITSGCISPCLQVPIAMGYIDICKANLGEVVYVNIRKHKIKMKICQMPFVKKQYV
jgi:aminomethyltransferase